MSVNAASEAGVIAESPGASKAPAERVSVGIAGLDEILGGGIPAGSSLLLHGGPGSGKTTIGAQFLAAGARLGESVLFITLDEPADMIVRRAAGCGIDLTGVTVLDMSPGPDVFTEVRTYDIFSPSDVEREPTTQRIVDAVRELRPSRVFIDPITQFRYLTPDVFQFRKQILSFLRFLAEGRATVVLSSEGSVLAPDDDLKFMSDAVLEIGADTVGRTVSVVKLRGSDFRPGCHAMRLTSEGVVVVPRIMPGSRVIPFTPDTLSSGVPALDALIGGGLERGTISLLTGPTGVGKTSLALQFASARAASHEKTVIYAFEEEPESMLHRADGLGMAARRHVADGWLVIEKVEPLRYGPDEFAALARDAAEHHDVRMVVLDSIAGYQVGLRGEDLRAHLHALCKYLQGRGVAVVLVNETEAITGDFRATEVGVSYLADNIIFLRYLEIDGRLRKAVGVLKKRLGDFERTLREIDFSSDGVRVGSPLTRYRGILSGAPVMTGDGDAHDDA